MTDDKRAYGNNMGKLSDEKLLKIAKEINRLNPKPKIEDQKDFLDILDEATKEFNQVHTHFFEE